MPVSGKVLGLGCGQPHGSAEILLKAALRAAETEGAEVELVRLDELRLPSGAAEGAEPDEPDLRAFGLGGPQRGLQQDLRAAVRLAAAQPEHGTAHRHRSTSSPVGAQPRPSARGEALFAILSL